MKSEKFKIIRSKTWWLRLLSLLFTFHFSLLAFSDTHITHIAWSQQAKRLIAVYQNSNIDLVETDGDIINISALYNKSMTDDKTVYKISIDGIYAYLHCGFGIVKVNLQRAEISATYTPNMPDYPIGLPEYQDDYDEYITTVSALNPGGPAYNHFYEARLLNGILYTTGGYFLPSIPEMVMTGRSLKRK